MLKGAAAVTAIGPLVRAFGYSSPFNPFLFASNVPLAAVIALSLNFSSSLELIVGAGKVVKYGLAAWISSGVLFLAFSYIFGIPFIAQGPVNLASAVLAWHDRQVPKRSLLVLGPNISVPTSVLLWTLLVALGNTQSNIQLVLGVLCSYLIPVSVGI